VIILLGTSHISPESINDIRKAINNETPDCVAVELDPMRYVSMMSKGKSNPPGIFLKILSWIQKKLGKMTGIFPGQEMLEAINFSNEKKIPAFFIDQDFRITVNDIQKISALEKFKLIFLAFFSTKRGNFDLKEVPSDFLVKESIKFLKKKFPQMYRVLVEKRNKHMSMAIESLREKYEKILVVVGAGHIEGLEKLLKDKNLKTMIW